MTLVAMLLQHSQSGEQRLQERHSLVLVHFVTTGLVCRMTSEQSIVLRKCSFNLRLRNSFPDSRFPGYFQQSFCDFTSLFSLLNFRQLQLHIVYIWLHCQLTVRRLSVFVVLYIQMRPARP